MKDIFQYTHDSLFNPTLKALHNLGGVATIGEIEKEVINILSLSDEQKNALHRGTTSKLAYRLAWARNYLKRYGLLDNPSRGKWKLTELGSKTTYVDEKIVRKRVLEGDR